LALISVVAMGKCPVNRYPASSRLIPRIHLSRSRERRSPLGRRARPASGACARVRPRRSSQPSNNCAARSDIFNPDSRRTARSPCPARQGACRDRTGSLLRARYRGWVGVDIAHAGAGGNVVAAHHHIVTGIDVQPLENERARHLVGVEVGAGSEEREPSSVVFSPQVRNLRLIR